MDELRAEFARWTGAYQRFVDQQTAWIDRALAFVVAVAGVAELSGYDFVRPRAYILVVLMTLPLALRRRYPLGVFLVVALALFTGGSQASFTSFVSLLIAAYTLSAYGRFWWLSVALLIVLAVGIDARYGGQVNLPQGATPFIIFAALFATGRAIRVRELRAQVSEQRAERIERDQELAREQALVQERARIARELHDIVTHHVSVMVVQAGAASEVMKSKPKAAREALQAVMETGRQALAELREFLGVLTPEGDDLPLAPQPTAVDIETLVRRVEDAGLPVELSLRGEPRPLPPAVGVAAYRVVQEALTNALKYAGKARTEVIVEYSDGELRLEVLDDGAGLAGGDATAGEGRGLIGMRERVERFGGTLQAGRRPSGGYAVRARLPLAPEST